MTKKDSKYDNVTHLTYLRTGQSHSCIHCGKQFHMDRISECANHYINDHEYKLSSARLGREASISRPTEAHRPGFGSPGWNFLSKYQNRCV